MCVLNKSFGGRFLVASAALLAVATSAGIALAGNGQAAEVSENSSKAGATSAQMPSAVEDFNYPDAEKILQEQGIKLIRGDGHIVLTSCGTSANEVHVRQRKVSKPVCFAVLGQGGYLTLDMPRVYGVKGNDFNTEVEMRVDDTTTSYDIDKNDWTSVGETADPDGRDHALIEIRSTK
ncbi:hypothetical protein [Streptomyces formicae]|nr:hypothetical protein [Streptomyces formicae]